MPAKASQVLTISKTQVAHILQDAYCNHSTDEDSDEEPLPEDVAEDAMNLVDWQVPNGKGGFDIIRGEDQSEEAEAAKAKSPMIPCSNGSYVHDPLQDRRRLRLLSEQKVEELGEINDCACRVCQKRAEWDGKGSARNELRSGKERRAL